MTISTVCDNMIMPLLTMRIEANVSNMYFSPHDNYISMIGFQLQFFLVNVCKLVLLIITFRKAF